MAHIKVVNNSDGRLLADWDFETNQEAVDAMAEYVGMPVNIDFQPNGARPMGQKKVEENLLTGIENVVS